MPSKKQTKSHELRVAEKLLSLLKRNSKTSKQTILRKVERLLVDFRIEASQIDNNLIFNLSDNNNLGGKSGKNKRSSRG